MFGLINLNKLENLSLEQLLEIKRKIDNEIDYKLSNEELTFIFNSKYKKLELISAEESKILNLNFILTEDGILFGYDNEHDLYIGVLKSDLQFKLLGINYSPKDYYKYRGKISLDTNLITKEKIKDLDNNISEYILEVLNSDRDTILYNQIPDNEDMINYDDTVEKTLIAIYHKFNKRINNFENLINIFFNNKFQNKVRKKEI